MSSVRTLIFYFHHKFGASILPPLLRPHAIFVLWSSSNRSLVCTHKTPMVFELDNGPILFSIYSTSRICARTCWWEALSLTMALSNDMLDGSYEDLLLARFLSSTLAGLWLLFEIHIRWCTLHRVRIMCRVHLQCGTNGEVKTCEKRRQKRLRINEYALECSIGEHLRWSIINVAQCMQS